MRGVRLAPTWLLVTGTAAAADLGVRVDGIAPLGGTLRVGLFDSAASGPSSPSATSRRGAMR